MSATILLGVIIGSIATVTIATIAMCVRNELTFRYRSHLLDLIHVAVKNDVENGRSYDWRYEMFDAVSYDQMTNCFWKPLKSFYPDKSFINPEVTE